jgi:hypothetical protein
MSAETAVIGKNAVIRQLNAATGGPRDTVTQMTTSLNSFVMAKSFGPDLEVTTPLDEATNTGTVPPIINTTPDEPANTTTDGKKKSSGSRRLIVLMIYIVGAAFLLFFVLAKTKVIKL